MEGHFWYYFMQTAFFLFLDMDWKDVFFICFPCDPVL